MSSERVPEEPCHLPHQFKYRWLQRQNKHKRCKQEEKCRYLFVPKSNCAEVESALKGRKPKLGPGKRQWLAPLLGTLWASLILKKNPLMNLLKLAKPWNTTEAGVPIWDVVVKDADTETAIVHLLLIAFLHKSCKDSSQLVIAKMCFTCKSSTLIVNFDFEKSTHRA